MKQPNVVFVFGDQWRQQATGYAGNPDVKTPNLDRLAKESVNFSNAISGCPVCCPYRASLLTGQPPLTHGVFLNDVCLQPNGASIAEIFSSAGYNTAYIGKWHLDGHGRSNWIPPERRHGFDYWKVLECTHNYNHSAYYSGNSEKKRHWNGYDARVQTDDAGAYIRDHAGKRPFLLMLSWGPPHAPYDTAPNYYRKLYDPAAISLRPNVPDPIASKAREWLTGYYAHCSALDACLGGLLNTLDEYGIGDDTIFVFTSDHGDMLGSQGQEKKQRPWDESVRVPFLLRYPRLAGWRAGKTDAIIDTPDILPTLLGLCNISIPETVEGLDFSDHIAGGDDPSRGAALLQCPHPFGQWSPSEHGAREYRGVRTKRYTYARDLHAPWLLYDNESDPYQMRNLIGIPQFATIQKNMERILSQMLEEQKDSFLPGTEYIKQWGYSVDQNGTVPYTD